MIYWRAYNIQDASWSYHLSAKEWKNPVRYRISERIREWRKQGGKVAILSEQPKIYALLSAGDSVGFERIEEIIGGTDTTRYGNTDVGSKRGDNGP